jgi:isopentenyl-diphosphate delta-isomerase
MEEQVILVNLTDDEIGTTGKLEAHKSGLLHRAFSTFIFNSKKELLLQKRAEHKYHSPHLWTNTCCSHPRPGETTLDAAKRRLIEEMGIDTVLTERKSFVYQALLENGLIEYEFDHIFTGTYEEAPVLNPNEASAYRWISLKDLRAEISANSEFFTAWLKIALQYLDEDNSDSPMSLVSDLSTTFDK